MKKNYFFTLLFTLCVSLISYAQGTETFEKSNATATYADGNFVGENGITWTYVHSRDADGTASNVSSLTTKALLLRQSSSSSKVTSSAISGGIGVIATHDQQGQGTIFTSSLGLIYSYHLKVNRKFSMLFGAKAAMTNKYLNWDKLTFGDMIDPRRGFVYTTNDVPNGNGKKTGIDFSGGFLVFSKNFY